VTVPVLETRGLYKSFGALEVSRDINFALHKGARHALIGPNGAGKTTFINLIAGVLKPTRGRILLDGADLGHLSQAERVKRGIARTFQINTLFPGLPVIENIMMAVAEHIGVAAEKFRPAGANPEVIERAQRLLETLHLEDDAVRLVRELPYGRQRLVEIAIALALEPKVLLLDEPAAGVPSTESHIILDMIDNLPADIAVMIIEHDMDVVFRFAREITVLVNGAVLAAGKPDDIANNDEVRAVYLGGAHNG
jgi:branched-chain amino acid transport system ATP-binding protein